MYFEWKYMFTEWVVNKIIFFWNKDRSWCPLMLVTILGRYDSSFTIAVK